MKHRTCTIDDCGKKHWAKGYCSYHYERFRREGKIAVSTCTIDGCGKPLHGKGLCVKHYRQKLRTGSPLADKVKGQSMYIR